MVDLQKNKTEEVWMDGEFVDWVDANVHALSHVIHYGTGVFEGIRCYDTNRGTVLFRQSAHYERLKQSAATLEMEWHHDISELEAATKQLISKNELGSCYVRPVMFYGFDSLGYSSYDECPTHTVIAAWPKPSKEIVPEDPVDVKISSWRKIHHAQLPTTAKLSGMYLNSVMAGKEVGDEYDRPLLLSENGTIAEGAADNVFVVKDGTVETPDIDSSILNGITRQTVVTLARDLGYDVEFKEITRHEAVTADEVFLTSTGSGITPVRSINDEVISEESGRVTSDICEMYVNVITGAETGYDQWVDDIEY